MIEPWIMPFSPESARQLLDVSRSGMVKTTVVVDWEGKPDLAELDSEAPATGFHQTGHFLRCLSGFDFYHVICRVNALGKHTAREIDQATEAGARALLFPMVRSASEVETLGSMIPAGVGFGVMIETPAVLDDVVHFGNLGVEFSFFGLLDFWKFSSRGSLFSPIVDGTIEQCRADLDGVRFGFGGLTLSGFGSPIPDYLVKSSLVAIGADFSMMRKSFFSALGHSSLPDGLNQVRDELSRLTELPHGELKERMSELRKLVDGLSGHSKG